MNSSRRTGFAVSIVLALCVSSIGHVNAQEEYKAFYLGVTGGAGYSAVLFDPSAGTQGIVSPVFGGLFRFESPEKKAIQVELRYRQAGWLEGSGYERTLNLIEMPVVANISFGKKRLKPFFTLGETLTLVVSESESPADLGQTPIFADFPVDNKFGFALNLGLGIAQHLKSSIIELEVRGTFHVTSLYETPNEIGISNSSPYFIEGVMRYLFKL